MRTRHGWPARRGGAWDRAPPPPLQRRPDPSTTASTSPWSWRGPWSRRPPRPGSSRPDTRRRSRSLTSMIPRASRWKTAAGRDAVARRRRGWTGGGRGGRGRPRTRRRPRPTTRMGLFATTAYWDGDLLTVHDSTQGTAFVRARSRRDFGIGESAVRVLAPFVGGAFGAGLRTWPHVVLAAVAARHAGRPVKLVLTRPQMFTSARLPPGHRPARQARRHAAGELVAIDHEGIEPHRALKTTTPNRSPGHPRLSTTARTCRGRDYSKKG